MNMMNIISHHFKIYFIKCITYTYTYIYIYIHIHTYIHIYIYIYTYTYIHIYIYIYIHIHTHTHTHTHVYIYIYIHTHSIKILKYYYKKIDIILNTYITYGHTSYHFWISVHYITEYQANLFSISPNTLKSRTCNKKGLLGSKW